MGWEGPELPKGPGRIGQLSIITGPHTLCLIAWLCPGPERRKVNELQSPGEQPPSSSSAFPVHHLPLEFQWVSLRMCQGVCMKLVLIGWPQRWWSDLFKPQYSHAVSLTGNYLGSSVLKGKNSTSQWFGCVHMCTVAQSYTTLGDPMDCSPPGSFVHGISQVRIVE